MTIPPVITPTPAPDVTSDDRIWVILCFLFTPLIPIVTLFVDDKKNRPFVKYHNIPALILGVVEIVVITILSFIPILGMLTGLLWIINVIYAVKANSGMNIDIPVITEYSKKQGWS
ncbi:MAG: hypothetical protein C0410_04865 [Anaerolinea sp.]|nr:hypothetical protein [Anaerolinea sp.]